MSHSVIYKVQVIIFFAHAGDNWHFNASCKGSPRLTFPNNIHHQHHSSQKWVGRFCKNLNIIKEQRQLLVIGKAWGGDSKLMRVVSIGAHLMSSSLAKIMTTLALGFSLSLRMILSNSPGLGSRGIFTDWEIHRSPEFEDKNGDKMKQMMSCHWLTP